jgi:hypothetical protein
MTKKPKKNNTYSNLNATTKRQDKRQSTMQKQTTKTKPGAAKT